VPRAASSTRPIALAAKTSQGLNPAVAWKTGERGDGIAGESGAAEREVKAVAAMQADDLGVVAGESAVA